MKKIKTIFETMLFAAVVLVMAQGCIPTTPVGGNPTPTNRFDINISSVAGLIQQSNSQMKMLYIDGDSILFLTSFSVGLFGGFTHQINIQVYSDNAYEYISNKGFISANIQIDSSDTTNQWTLFAYGSSSYQLVRVTITYSFDLFKNDLPYNTDRYIIFRKFKTSGYMYYWVKIRYTDNVNILQYHDYTISVASGKYQMNSIITGQ